jgi:hypothetical protein
MLGAERIRDQMWDRMEAVYLSHRDTLWQQYPDGGAALVSPWGVAKTAECGRDLLKEAEAKGFRVFAWGSTHGEDGEASEPVLPDRKLFPPELYRGPAHEENC